MRPPVGLLRLRREADESLQKLREKQSSGLLVWGYARDKEMGRPQFEQTDGGSREGILLYTRRHSGLGISLYTFASSR